jgi:hypothetical protein
MYYKDQALPQPPALANKRLPIPEVVLTQGNGRGCKPDNETRAAKKSEKSERSEKMVFCQFSIGNRYRPISSNHNRVWGFFGFFEKFSGVYGGRGSGNHNLNRNPNPNLKGQSGKLTNRPVKVSTPPY